MRSKLSQKVDECKPLGGGDMGGGGGYAPPAQDQGFDPYFADASAVIGGQAGPHTT